MKLMIKLVLPVALLLGIAACGKSAGGQRSSGDVVVNGAALDGAVHVGEKRFYTLKNIVTAEKYAVRTQVASNGGTLAMEIFDSETAYKNGQPSIATAGQTFVYSSPSPTGAYSTYYEAQFTASQGGDHVVVISGVPADPTDIVQSFFGLRLTSSSPSSLTSFTTPTTGTNIAVDENRYIDAGTVKVYSGATVSPPDIYTIGLTSTATATLYNPHVFVYSDDSLTLGKLLYSSLSSSSGFTISSFNVISSPTSTITTLTTTATTTSDTARIPGVAFSATGPYIVIKGNANLNYTLTVGP